MIDKFLITVIVPDLEQNFDVYIPNEIKVGTLKKYILDSIKEMTENEFDKDFSQVRLVDRATYLEYNNDIYVRDTEIKNGSQLIII